MFASQKNKVIRTSLLHQHASLKIFTFYFNTQFYGSYSLDAYDEVIKNGYDSKMIVMGTMNPNVFDTVSKVYEKYGKSFGGVYLWEYMFAQPDGYTWANKMYNIFNEGLFTTILKYLSLYRYIYKF